MPEFYKPESLPLTPVWIETGTLHGCSITCALNYGYKEIHSVEFNPEFVQKAREKFKDYPNVTIHEGASPLVLPKIIDPNKETTFWLDAHWSRLGPPASLDIRYGECPLIEELKAIISKKWTKTCYIVIDDSYQFDDDYWEGRKVNHFNPKHWVRAEWPRFKDICAVLPNYRMENDGSRLFFYPMEKLD